MIENFNKVGLAPTDTWSKHDVDYGWCSGEEDETAFIIGRQDFYHFIFPNNWGVMVEVYTKYEDDAPTDNQKVTLQVTKAGCRVGKESSYSEQDLLSIVESTKIKETIILPKEGDIVMYDYKLGVCKSISNLWCEITTMEGKVVAGALTILQIGDRVGWRSSNHVLGQVEKRKVIIKNNRLIPFVLLKGRKNFMGCEDLIIFKSKEITDISASQPKVLWAD